MIDPPPPWPSPAVAGQGIRTLEAPGWDRWPGLVHGFFGRAGGISTGELGTLNLGSRVGDDPAHVRENWQRARASLGGIDVVTMQQVHGVDLVRITGAIHPPGEADGVYTDNTGIGLAVLTADCVPILLIEPTRKLAIAVHAGWRGSLGGIAANAVKTVAAEFGVDPTDLHAALGPSINGCCYEVEAELGERFVTAWGTMPDAWQRAGTHGHLDLRAVNQRILREAGVPGDQIINVGPCTSCECETFFSHRASGGKAGRQASIIGWLA